MQCVVYDYRCRYRIILYWEYLYIIHFLYFPTISNEQRYKQKNTHEKTNLPKKQCNKSFNGSKCLVNKIPPPKLNECINGMDGWMMRVKRTHQPLAFIYYIKNYICTLFLNLLLLLYKRFPSSVEHFIFHVIKPILYNSRFHVRTNRTE